MDKKRISETLPSFRFKVTYFYLVMELQVNRDHEETLQMEMRKFGTRHTVDLLVEFEQLSDPQ
jgi:hypothetical protein